MQPGAKGDAGMQQATPSTRSQALALARQAVLEGGSATHPWYRRGALGIALVRVALGTAALAFPEAAGRAWIGRGADGRDRAVLLRALGGRDVALGLGALLAVRRARGARPWLFMGALSDLVDTVATGMGFDELPALRRWLVVAASTGAAVSGAVLALNIADAKEPRPAPPV